jgi:CHAD domain-containing protein
VGGRTRNWMAKYESYNRQSWGSVSTSPMGKMLLERSSFAMKRNSKWIEIESYDEPVTDVAQRALRARLKLVWHCLRLAANSRDNSVENVHQLRIATRRAMATLQQFSDLLPQRRSRWFQKKLKHIRRTAGVVRDLDVLINRLKSAEDKGDPIGLASLIASARTDRDRAQPVIREMYTKLKGQSFAGRTKKLVRRVRNRTESPLDYLTAAKCGLRPLAHDFFAASEADFECISSLHEFRIAGKELRYAMEVFAAAFAPEFKDDLYATVERLQELLGAVNDHANAQNSYLSWLDKTEDEADRIVLGKLIAVEANALRESVEQFRQWWTPSRAADFKSRFWQQVFPSEIRCA